MNEKLPIVIDLDSFTNIIVAVNVVVEYMKHKGINRTVINRFLNEVLEKNSEIPDKLKKWVHVIERK